MRPVESRDAAGDVYCYYINFTGEKYFQNGHKMSSSYFYLRRNESRKLTFA